MPLLCRLAGLLCVWLSTASLQANSLYVPEALEPWKAWVLHDESTFHCPYSHKSHSQRQCIWPGKLTLNAGNFGATFHQTWHVFSDSLIPLPGGDGFWPMTVTVNDAPVILVEKKGKPYIKIPPGNHLVQGIFQWQTLPDALFIPAETALLELTVNNRVHAYWNRDREGRLWLIKRKQASRPDHEVEDKLSVRVYRHLKDGIPFTVVTRVELEVAGKPREMALGKVLFDAFTLAELNSGLPARVDDDGRLRVQLRPGKWQLTIHTYRLSPADGLFLENSQEGVWPEEEVWVFESVPGLRQVRVEGLEGLDPNQTALPDLWKQWPAYQIKAGQKMTLSLLRRGDPLPSPNQITSHRDIWLDFDGAGLTVRDALQGKLFRRWRLNAHEQMDLGSVHLNADPMLVTTLKQQQGVELRSGKLNAVSLARVPVMSQHEIRLSSSGWQQDMERLSAVLHLPPGWRAFTVMGVDRVSNTWMVNWRVWDVFVVLITIAAVVRLRGKLAGLVSGFALVLIYPEATAFLYLLLNMIVVMGVMRLLPPGYLRKCLKAYGGVSGLILLIWLLSFMVEQARLGLYPQLAKPWIQMGKNTSALSESQPQNLARSKQVLASSQASPPGMMESVEEAQVDQYSVSSRASSRPSKTKKKIASYYDAPSERLEPGMAVQTGPGLPLWRWQQVRLNWSGPVTQEEQFTVWLMTPLESRILNWARVLLSALLVLSVFGLTRVKGRWRFTFLKAKKAIMVFCMGGGLLCLPVSEKAVAELPDDKVLSTLKKRLIKEGDCTPHCFSIKQGQIEVEDGRLTLRLTLHALQQVYWPLPNSQKQWFVDAALLNSEPHTLLKQRKKGHRVLIPAGENDITVTGMIMTKKPFQLSFSVPLHNVSVQAKGFAVTGLKNGRLISDSVFFEPEIRDGDSAVVASEDWSPNAISPFVTVERHLRFSMNWYLETTVTRVAPKQGGIRLDIPLIAGESVTSQRVEVDKNVAKVNLKPGEQQLVWHSALEKTSMLTLSAAKGPWSESWAMTISPLWHASFDGLVPIKPEKNQTHWQPQWRPYPGESVIVHLVRPASAVGKTKTIDYIHQLWKPGQRESESKLRMHVISSKGFEQRITLPNEARVKSVSVDGDARAIDELNPQLIIPVNPGDHWLEVRWRQSEVFPYRAVTPQVGLGDDYANHTIRVQVPENRWVLWVGGPEMGPALLFWGVLILSVFIGLALGRLSHLPLNGLQWVMLILGLCTGWIEMLIPIALWFFMMEKRASSSLVHLSRAQFNLMQVMLFVFSLVVFVLLLAAIPRGLIGSPDMGIVGNGSSQFRLNWFMDQGQGDLASAWMISVPLWVYRVLMLVWSLWLVVHLLPWLKWGWQAFTQGGYWRSPIKAKKVVPEHSPSTESTPEAAIKLESEPKEPPTDGRSQ